MKKNHAVLAVILLIFLQAGALAQKDTRHLFFLHGRFVQLYDLDAVHPEYGRAEYLEILDKFAKAGFKVMSEKRPVKTDGRSYAKKVVRQIDSLLKMGVRPCDITVVGTSMGGYIAQYVSTYVKNPDINFVFIASFMERDLAESPEIQYCGNILSIYERSDTLGVSAIKRKEKSALKIPHFKEIELHTNLRHGFIYHPMDEWIQPTIQWARGNYGMVVKTEIQKQIETLLKSQSNNPFNGVILIKENDSTTYSKIQGYANIEHKTPLAANTPFVIGSISKQFTAVLTLLEMEQGHLALNDIIGKHLPRLGQPWKDSVTIYHLLTHTHGITSVDQPLSFKPGTKMDYGGGNNTGYQLLSEIIEKTSGKKFAQLSGDLFEKCGMSQTFHPGVKKYGPLAKGYIQKNDGSLVPDSTGVRCSPAAGGFISTALDLVTWNECLHGGKILKPGTYTLMTTIQPHVVRQHPLFGATEYGLGLTAGDNENIVQLGQTGYVPGYVSLSHYFPGTKTSLVVLQNTDHEGSNAEKFHYPAQINEMLREKLKTGKSAAEKKQFIHEKDTLPYRLIYPAKEKPTEKMPLLVYLHGMGSRGSDNETPLQRFLPFITDPVTGQCKFRCFVLIPQCPQSDVWVSFPHFPASLATTTPPTPSAKMVLELIHHLAETKDIDTNRIYLTGYSMGGEGTFDLLSREPGLFACGVPLAAVADTAKANTIQNIPLWIFHGSNDQVNDVKYVRLEVEAIREKGGQLKYTEVKGGQHDCREQAYQNPEVWKWIFEQHK